ncbi:MAG: hypothetical protein HFJ10_03305 [Lachnospiraceae bacterium]|nr:hypothetical protein [Lachnospiraceae bacterium]
MKLQKRKLVKKLAAILAVLVFLSSELPAYAELVPQTTEAQNQEGHTEQTTEETDRETFEYPEANIYEGETPSDGEGSLGQEPSVGEEGSTGQEPTVDEEDSTDQDSTVNGEEPTDQDPSEEETPSEEGPAEEETASEEDPDSGEEDITEEETGEREEQLLTAPDLLEEPLPYEVAGETLIETGRYYKIYQKPDGSFRTVYTSTPNVYENEEGEEQLIDNTLVIQDENHISTYSIEESPSESTLKDTVYTNAANDMHTELPAEMDLKAGEGLSIETKEGNRLELVPAEGDYSHSIPEENAIRYNQIFDGIDVQYTVKESSVKEDIILLKPSERNSFEYLLKKEGITAQEDHGTIRIYSEGEEDPFAILTAPGMSDEAGAKSSQVSLSLSEEEEAYRITVTADEEWLSAPERVYPVKIDPNTEIVKKELTLITLASDYQYGTYNGLSPLYAGYTTRNGFGKCRLFLISAYQYPEIGSDGEGTVSILSASLHLYQTEKLGDSRLICYRLGEQADFRGIEEAGPDKWNRLASIDREIAGASATATSGVGWKVFDITDSVNGWHEKLYDSNGLVLIAEDETKGVGAFASEQDSDASLHPWYEITWKYQDEIDPNYPLNNTTLNLRTIMQTDLSGRLNLLGVFADGMATPGADIVYALSDSSKNYGGIVQAKTRPAYPNSESFESAFPKGSTRYRQAIHNWQTTIPFTNLDNNVVYQLETAAVKNGVTGKKVISDEFLKYRVTRYDTLGKIADYYGVPLSQILFDNRAVDALAVENNTLFIRNPQKNKNKPYQPAQLTDADKAAIDSQLMGRGLHCEFGFEPVNLNTGNFYLEQTDSTIPDYTGRMEITRSYNSRSADYMGAFGRGFTFSFDEQLVRKDETTILYRRGDGSTLEMKKQADGTYEAPAGYDLTLKEIKEGEGEITNPVTEEDAEKAAQGETVFGTYPIYRYELEEKDGGVRQFNTQGQLTRITDKKGNSLSLTYEDPGLLKSIETE